MNKKLVAYFATIALLFSADLAGQNYYGPATIGPTTPGNCLKAGEQQGQIVDSGGTCGGGGGGGSPGGSNNSIQYNNLGSFGGFSVSGDASLAVPSGTLQVTATHLSSPLPVAQGGLGGATSAMVPTIANGFCSGAAIANASGTLVFDVRVGTSCSGSTGTLTMPTAAAHGWVCSANDVTTTTPDTYLTKETATTTSTVTFTVYSDVSNVSSWEDNDDIQISCYGH